MKPQFFTIPKPHFIIKNLFGKVINRNILDEAVSLKQKFHESSLAKISRLDTFFRNNKVIFYDEIYLPRPTRKKSALLTSINKLFKSDKFGEVLNSSEYPIVDFNQTNTHETQVSRYGNEGQKYKWHVDRIDHSRKRHLSMVYYFFKEPKKFKGGSLELTDSPIYNGKPINKKLLIKTIEPENDMAVIFGAYTPHQVLPTTSPKKFSDGRFSSNIWIGFR